MGNQKPNYMKMISLQTQINAPKTQNPNVQYWSRSKEDILSAVKPLLVVEKCIIIIHEEVQIINESKFMQSTAKLIDCESGIIIAEANGFCEFIKPSKFMDEAKVTGTASSYAGKNALCNLLAIDGQSDHDYVYVEKEDIDQQIEWLKEKAKGNEARTTYLLKSSKVSSLDDLSSENITTRRASMMLKKWEK